MPRRRSRKNALANVNTNTGARSCTGAVYSDATAQRMARSRRRRPRKAPHSSSTKLASTAPPKAPGARVARVAVDDATWAAFRELCGSTPASIRLGQLVEADVRRARSSDRASANAALATIRAQVNTLETLLIAGGGEVRHDEP